MEPASILSSQASCQRAEIWLRNGYLVVFFLPCTPDVFGRAPAQFPSTHPPAGVHKVSDLLGVYSPWCRGGGDVFHGSMCA